MRHRYVGLILLVCLAISATPARAQIMVLDPEEEPEVTLEAAEAQKLAQLQAVTSSTILSDVSPDDGSILVSTSAGDEAQWAFVDVNEGLLTPVDRAALDLQPLTEIRWSDNHTAVYVSDGDADGPVLVSLDRNRGSVVTRTLDLPGFPISMAPNGSRLVLAIRPHSEERSRRALTPSPFDIRLQRPWLEPPGPEHFDAGRTPLQVSSGPVTLVTLDLSSGQTAEMLTMPEGSGVISIGWMEDGSKLALVRTTISRLGHEGNLLSEVETQDALGLIAPEKNPFLQGNVVDTFDFARHDYRSGALKAGAGDGYTFARAAWSTDGKTLMAQVQRPSKLTGRRYPIYQAADRSALRFYDANLKPSGTFDRPELEAPNLSLPRWVSPDEMIVAAPYGLSFRLYYYNRVSGEFRQLSIEDGTYYQFRATHHSRKVVYRFSSFQTPPELYRIGWDGGEPRPLTALNTGVTHENQIRADKVTFTMRSGARRSGYILQPAGAPFPPRNTPMIVWQQGGPGFSMTNEWASNVEQPFNLLPNFGMALLMLPLPGREGFGPGFYDDLANGRNFGAVDVDEAAEAVEQMIARGYTSRGKVGITGCSYGGFFTSQSITRHPRMYAAANSQCTLLDLFAEWQFGQTVLLSYLEGRPPTADAAEYTRDSPVYNAVRVRTPLLLFAGTRDFLPASISANFHDQIAAGGWPVELLLWEGEGHGLQARNSQFAAAQAQIQWFRRYLGGHNSR